MTPEEQDRLREEDQANNSMIFSKMKKDYPIRYKEEYPLEITSIEDYYWDQARSSTCIGDRCISAAYLPYGIKQFDSWYAKQIQLGPESKYSKEELEDNIKRNPHLHNVIKTNLLSNLNR
jgi:hypothetical protein